MSLAPSGCAARRPVWAALEGGPWGAETWLAVIVVFSWSRLRCRAIWVHALGTVQTSRSYHSTPRVFARHVIGQLSAGRHSEPVLGHTGRLQLALPTCQCVGFVIL